MARHDEQMANALALLRKKSELGRRIIGPAEQHKVGFLRRDFKDSSRGLYQSNTVSLSVKNSFPEDVNLIPHELMHWIQNPREHPTHRDFRSRLLYVLSEEAGAETCAVKVSHQVRENGYASAFNLKARAPLWRGYRKIYETFDNVLQNSRAQDRDDPVLDATDAAFHAYFEQPGLALYYGQNLLLEYMNNLSQLVQHYPVPGFSFKKAEKLARLNDHEYLVYSPVRLPLTDNELFRGNDYLRQAFEYVEMIHILNYCGADETALAFHRKMTALEKDENPFRSLNLHTILAAYNDQKDQKYAKDIVRVMMDLAGVKEWKDPQASFDFG
ncbi:MAG: hypothetical protein LRY54_03545 [Alphaproteobacteria bacterium]|nr:hypothetical protein [Alphaproteobacteria bacterium]